MIDKVKASLCLKMINDAEANAKRRMEIINNHLEERMRQPYEQQIIPEHITILLDESIRIENR